MMNPRDPAETLPQSPLAAAPDAAAPPDAARGRHKALFIVFLVVFIDLLGFGIVLPLLPVYATDILQPLYPGDNQGFARGALLGLLMASFSFMQFLFAPVWGRLSDRIGRRPILILGLAGSVVFYALFGYASQVGLQAEVTNDRRILALVLLFLARIGAGLAGATISTAQAVIADCTPPDRRARGMALIGAAFGIGFTFGPLLGLASLFVPRDSAPGLAEGAPGYAAAALSLVALALALALLPETLRAGATGGRRHWLKLDSLAGVLRTPVVGSLVLTFFLATLAFASLESTLALINRHLLSPAAETHRVPLTREAARTINRESFLIFAFVGLVLMIIQGFVYRRLVNRVGEVRFLRLGVLLMLLGLAGVIVLLLLVNSGRLAGAGPVIALSLVILTVLVAGYALMTPSVQSLISRLSDPDRQGEILGANQSASALARILGPLASGFLFEVDTSHLAPYLLGAALMLPVLLLTRRLASPAPAPNPEIP